MAFKSPENAVGEPVRSRPVDPVLIRARRRLARRIHLGVGRIVPAGDLTGLEERQEQRADFVRRKEMSSDGAIDQMSLLMRNRRSAWLRTRSQTWNRTHSRDATARLELALDPAGSTLVQLGVDFAANGRPDRRQEALLRDLLCGGVGRVGLGDRNRPFGEVADRDERDAGHSAKERQRRRGGGQARHGVDKVTRVDVRRLLEAFLRQRDAPVSPEEESRATRRRNSPGAGRKECRLCPQHRSS